MDLVRKGVTAFCELCISHLSSASSKKRIVEGSTVVPTFFYLCIIEFDVLGWY